MPLYGLFELIYKIKKFDFLGKQLGSFLDLVDRLNILPTNDVYCNSPIFITSIGWRCGSTLLQRIICSSSNTIIWGEPFERLFFLGRLGSILSNIKSESNEEFLWTIQESNKLESKWIANLNPGVSNLVNGCRAFIEESLAHPSKKLGFKIWGAKWVRVSGYYARFLQYLYPNAKFLILFRHPLSSYQSYKGKKWSAIYPYLWIKTSVQFFYYWSNLAKSFIVNKDKLNCKFVMYEDLVNSPYEEVNKLSNFLDLQLDVSVINKRRGASIHKKKISCFSKLYYFIFSKKIYENLRDIYGKNTKVI